LTPNTFHQQDKKQEKPVEHELAKLLAAWMPPSSVQEPTWIM